MLKFLKIVSASILLLGMASTAQAGAHNSAKANIASPTHAKATHLKTSNKKVIRTVKRLPQARKAATHSTRTVLFYNPTTSRSKIIRGLKTKTSTPNLFN